MTVPAFGPVVYCVVAVPSELVVTVAAEKVPPAPLSEKVTLTPGTARPWESVTFTTRGSGSGVFGAAVWLFPAVMVRCAGAPGVLVSVNEAVV